MKKTLLAALGALALTAAPLETEGHDYRGCGSQGHYYGGYYGYPSYGYYNGWNSWQSWNGGSWGGCATPVYPYYPSRPGVGFFVSPVPGFGFSFRSW